MAKERDDTIASRISRVLADRIIRGELAPDARLRQDHIAEEFGTSHVPVREAFRRLEAQGLAINLPRRGVRVASPPTPPSTPSGSTRTCSTRPASPTHPAR